MKDASTPTPSLFSKGKAFFLGFRKAWFIGLLPLSVLCCLGVATSASDLYNPPQTGDDDNTALLAQTILNFEEVGILHMRGLSNWTPSATGLLQNPQKSWLYISYPPLWNTFPYLAHHSISLVWPSINEPINTIYFIRFYNLLFNRILFLFVLFSLFLVLFQQSFASTSASRSVLSALLVVLPVSISPLFLYVTQNTYGTDETPFLPISAMLLIYLLGERPGFSQTRLFRFAVFSAAFVAFGMEWLGSMASALLIVLEYQRTFPRVTSYLKHHMAGFFASATLYLFQVLWYPAGVSQLTQRLIQRAGIGTDIGLSLVWERLVGFLRLFFLNSPLLLFLAALLLVVVLVDLWFRRKSAPKLFQVLFVISVCPLLHALLLREHFTIFRFSLLKLIFVAMAMLAAVPLILARLHVREGKQVSTISVLLVLLAIPGIWQMRDGYKAIVQTDRLNVMQAVLKTLAISLKTHFPNEKLFVSRTDSIGAHSMIAVFYLQNFVFDSKTFSWLFHYGRFNSSLVNEKTNALLLFHPGERLDLQCAKEVCKDNFQPLHEMDGISACRTIVKPFLETPSCKFF